MAWDLVMDPMDTAPKPGGLKSELDAGLASASAGLNAIPAAMGSDSALREMREQQRIAGNATQFAARAGIPQSVSDIHGPIDVLKFAGGQAVAAAPVLGAAALGTMAAGPVGGAAAVAPLTIGGNLAAQYEHNQSFNGTAAVAAGIPQAALMVAAPEARLFQRGVGAVEGAAIDTGSRIGNAVVRGGMTGASQAANMGATAAFGEANISGVDPNYDIYSDKSLQNVGEAAAGGFIAGGLIGAGHGLISRAEPMPKGGDVKPGELPTTTATSPDVDPNAQWNLLDSPAYQRQGVATDANGIPTGADQRVLDLRGGKDTSGEFKPGFDAKGNPLPVDKSSFPDVNGADVGPIPAAAELSGKQGDLFKDGSLSELGPRQGTGIDNGTVLGEQPPAARPIEIPGQATPNPDARVVGAQGPSLYDQYLEAQRAKAAGQALDQNQVALLRNPPPAPNEGVQLAVEQARGRQPQQPTPIGSQVGERQGTGIGGNEPIIGAQPEAPAPQPLVLPGQENAAVPNPGARLEGVPQGPTQHDLYQLALAAQKRGELLTPDQQALLRHPPEAPQPVNPNAKIATPEISGKGEFKLTPDRREFGATEQRPAADLAHSEAPDARQMELPLGEPRDLAEAPANRQQGDLFGHSQQSATLDSRTPWQTRMRMAWADHSEGGLQGFHKSMAKVLSAKTPEEAAAMIREKADDSKSGTAYKKLDAIHRALTGEGLEEHATREATKPVEGVVEGEAKPAAPAVEHNAEPAKADGGEKAAPAAGEIKPAVEEAKPAKKGVHADKIAEVDSIVKSLDDIPADDAVAYQKQADRLYEIAQTTNGKAHDYAMEALHKRENFFTDENIAQAEKNYTDKKLNEIVKASEAGVKVHVARHTAEAAPEAKAGMRQGERTNADQVVAHLAANSTDPNVRQAMKAVGKNVDLSKVTIERVGPDSELHPAIAHALSDGADGAIARFPDGRMTIHLAADAGEEAIAHELVHAATLAKLDDPASAKPFVDLMNEVKSRLVGSDHPDAALFNKHALGDVKEFVAYAATNERFRALLDHLDQPGKLSAWDKFKQLVGKALSIPKVFVDKLLGKGKSEFVSGTKLRFDAELNRMLEEGAPAAQREAAEIKLHTFSTSPEAMADGLKVGAQTVWDSVKALASKTMLGAMPTHVIVDQFKHQLRSLPAVQRAIEDRTARQHQLARAGIEVHDALKAAFKDQKSLDRLHRTFENAQLANIDPRTEPMDRVQSYLKVAKEKLDALPKDATPLQRMRAEAHLKKAAAGAALKADWSAMSDAEKKAFTTAVDKLKQSMETRQQVANDILLRSADSFHDPLLDKMREEGATKEQIDQHIIDTYGKVFKTVDGAYAPLKRFGDWVVSRSSPELHQAEQALRAARTAADAERAANGKLSEATNTKLRDAEELVDRMNADGAHRSVTFHESSADAQREYDAARADYKGHDIKRFTRDDYNKSVTAANGATIGKILEAVGKELPPELRENVTSLIRDMYVDALPDGSFQQVQQERAGVAGYSRDFSRSILDSLMRDSFQISTLEHSEGIGDAMRALDAERQRAGTDNANNIYRTLTARLDASTNFKEFAKWEQSISHAAHVMYLGASPAFLLMNAAQVPMITLPMLHARFGYAPKVEAHMSKAVADVWKAIRKSRLEVNDYHGFSAEEKQVLTRLQDLGILNMTQMHDTAQAARSSNIIDPKNLGEAIGKRSDQALNAVNLPAQYVETVNRAASALAAYRLAREGSKFGVMDHGAAMDYAAKIVRDSHVDYSAANNPAWMKNGFMPGSRLLFQFKKYWINMLSMVSSNMWDAFGHGSDIKGLRNKLADASLSEEARADHTEMLNQLTERRSVARQTLAGLYGMHMLTTGAMGVPFAGTGILLADVMRHWYQDPEDHADTETDIRNYLAHAFGAEAGDVVMDGVFAGLFGMGISKRIGMGDLAAPSRLPKSTLQGKDWGKEFLINLAGPTAGMGLNWMDAAHDFEQGDYHRGWEKMLPKMLADPLKGFRRLQDGGEASGNGKMVAKTDERDALLTALGITPQSVVKGYEAKNAVDASKITFDRERGSLIKNMATAALHGDSEDQVAARAEIKAFNERNPGMGLKITASDLLKAQNAMKNPPKGPKPGSAAAARQAEFDKEGDFAKDE